MNQEELNTLVHDYLELDSSIKQQQVTAERMKNQLKEELEARQVEEAVCGEHIVRYRNVISTTFDLSSFKNRFSDLYTLFIKQIPSKKFSIS